VKKKILAVEMILLLIVSGFVGYVIVSRQGSVNSTTNDTQDDTVVEETIKTTGEAPSSLQAQIDAGPLTGYGPLTVTFYGNPENDPNIVSYHWDFDPKTVPIVPQSQYKQMRFSFALFLLLAVVFFPLSFAYGFLYVLITNLRYKAGSQHESTEQNPTMIFPYTGSYSATLTVIDAQGNTDSDTVWITVLQNEHPDHD
jgi:PKD repeat protein